MFPNIIYSYYFYVFWNFAENIRFYVFQLILFHDRGTSAPPSFKPICSRGNVSLLWDILALCASAWADVVGTCPGME